MQSAIIMQSIKKMEADTVLGSTISEQYRIFNPKP